MSKTIVITGAGEGLGRTLARHFVADGDRVALLGRTFAKVEALAQELGDNAIAVQCDVGNPASVREAFAYIGDCYDLIDVLINNAAQYDPFLLENATDEQITGMIATNLTGPILCSREALGFFGDSGRIINVSSESVGLKFAMQWLYTATKAGLEMAGSMLDRELAPRGVRVTTIRCGQMYDESKQGSNWPMELAVQFMTENMKVGIDFRNRTLSQYKSVAEVFHHVIHAPGDVHIGHIEINGDGTLKGTDKA